MSDSALGGGRGVGREGRRRGIGVDSALGGGRGVGRECRSGMPVGKAESALVSSSFCFVLFCFVFVCFVLKSPNPGQFRKTPRQQKSIMSRKKIGLVW